MPPFIPITNINAIVSDCFHDYYGPGNPACVLRDVVPILWFGDMDAYFASEKKIVTIAVNPSDKEFIVNGVCSINNRFPGAPANYDSLVRDDGKAQAIYSPGDTMPESYKIRRAGDINKYMVNGKPYYIFPEASSWRGKNHKQDFIDHIKTISKIFDKNVNPLFFDVGDEQAIINELEVI